MAYKNVKFIRFHRKAHTKNIHLKYPCQDILLKFAWNSQAVDQPVFVWYLAIFESG
ncbi:MAG: hypothetical protein HZB81_00110 [Deltaproteobacteria bacterium]|nr:hypothetical protein [Deltaproteobacteria bacterium]